MPTNSPAGLIVPSAGDAPNVPADLLRLATALDLVTIPRFASIAARTAALPSPLEGQRSTVAGIGYIVVNGVWRNVDLAWFNATVTVPQGATFNAGNWALNAGESVNPSASANGLSIALPANSVVSIQANFYIPGGMGGSIFRILRMSDQYILAQVNPSTIAAEVWTASIPALSTGNYPAITCSIYNNHSADRIVNTTLIIRREV